MGRPRLARPVSENQKGASSDSHSHARHSKQRAVQAGNQRGATAVPLPVDHVDQASTATTASAHARSGDAGPGSPGNLEPVLGLLDPVLLPEGKVHTPADPACRNRKAK